MAITQTDVTRAFSIVSGSTNLVTNNLTVTYIKNTNTIPADIPITVANSSTEFFIKATPAPSNLVLQVYRSGSTALVDMNNPIIIPPTGSRELIVRLGTTLENFETQTRTESITFNLVAMVRQTITGAASSNTGATGAGAGSSTGGGSGASDAGGSSDGNIDRQITEI